MIIFDHLGIVNYKGIELKEFHRKQVLRQILAFLIEVYPLGVNKNQLAPVIWGEPYSSVQHDARIYTSIQRLRQLIKSECIETWMSGYRWSPQISFALIKPTKLTVLSSSKVQIIILQTLLNFQKSGVEWATRGDLVEATQSSESTVKRELSKLLIEGKILRKGAGPRVFYSLKSMKD